MATTPSKIQKHFNVLSFDAGGLWDSVMPRLTKRLTEDKARLLRNTDLFVGVAAGGVHALGLAAGASPELMYVLFEACSKKANPKSLTRGLKKELSTQFGDMRLGELSKKVAVLTFKLDNKAGDPVLRTWKPKIYHNFIGPDSDSEETVVDVAMRTLAIPLLSPPYQGHIGGTIVTGNPSIIGLAQALDARNEDRPLSDVALLSIGAGVSNRFIERPDPTGPKLDEGVLLDLMAEASINTPHFACKVILKDKYFRINPHLGTAFAATDPAKFTQASVIAEKHDLTSALQWIDKYWI